MRCTESDNSDVLKEERSLFEAYRRTSDPAVRDAIFSKYQSIVESIVRNYVRSAEREDLLQVGYIGLVNAIERFDFEKGFRFSTYATHCVEGEIRHFLRDKTEVIRRPRWVRKLSGQVASFLEKFQHEHQRLPSLSEISHGLNIAEDGVRAILMAKQPASLDDGGVGDECLRERVRSSRLESFRLPIEDRIAISQAFERLLGLEKKIIYLFFVQDFTQREIAGKLSLSPRKVSRVMQRALEALRRELIENVSKKEPSKED